MTNPIRLVDHFHFILTETVTTLMNSKKQTMILTAVIAAVVGISGVGVGVGAGQALAADAHPTTYRSSRSTVMEPAKAVFAPLTLVNKPEILENGLQYGMLATTSVGMWSPNSSALTYTYQWYENGRAVHGATHPTHTVGVAAATSRSLSVAVTAHLPGRTPVTSMSDPVSPVTKSLATELKVTSDVAVPSKLAEGTELKAPTLSWFVKAPAITGYQWSRNAMPITGAVRSTYFLTAADAGTTITLNVFVSKPGYSSGSVPSQKIAIPMF
jgi:hypothetical protein